MYFLELKVKGEFIKLRPSRFFIVCYFRKLRAFIEYPNEQFRIVYYFNSKKTKKN